MVLLILCRIVPYIIFAAFPRLPIHSDSIHRLLVGTAYDSLTISETERKRQMNDHLMSLQYTRYQK